MLTCKFCGSSNITTVGGMDGNPFDKAPQKTICKDCGAVLSNEGDVWETLCKMAEEQMAEEKRFVRLEMHAHAMGVHRTEVLEVPFEDSEYSLWEMNYPLCRFGKFKIEGGTVAIDNEISLLTRHPIKTVKHFTAYGPDKVPWEETLEITITEVWK